MQWTNVKDELPDEYDYVLVYAQMPGDEPCPISIARYAKNRWELLYEDPDSSNACACGDLSWDIDIEDITHWMALPKKPPIVIFTERNMKKLMNEEKKIYMDIKDGVLVIIERKVDDHFLLNKVDVMNMFESFLDEFMTSGRPCKAILVKTTSASKSFEFPFSPGPQEANCE